MDQLPEFVFGPFALGQWPYVFAVAATVGVIGAGWERFKYRKRPNDD